MLVECIDCLKDFSDLRVEIFGEGCGQVCDLCAWFCLEFGDLFAYNFLEVGFHIIHNLFMEGFCIDNVGVIC